MLRILLLVFVMGTFSNIAKRAQAEEKLETKEYFYKTIIEN